MSISLRKADLSDAELIWRMQIASFRALLDKYQDYDYSPGAETLERAIQRVSHPSADHWLILLNGTPIGAVGIGRYEDRCKLKRLFILPEHQNHGYAQQAVRLVESHYPAVRRWELDTILQEKKLCHLYEKLGYQQTGQTRPLKPGMDLVFYAK